MNIDIGVILEHLPPLITSHLVVLRLERLYEQLIKFYTPDKLKLIILAEAYRDSSALYQYLRFHLQSRPVNVAGQPATLMRRDLGRKTLDIPVCVLASGNDVKLAPLTHLQLHYDETWKNSEYVKALGLINRDIQDNVVYTANTIAVTGNSALITGGLSTYCACLATQDALEWELLSKASQTLNSPDTVSDFPKLLSQLTNRRAAEDMAGNYLLSGRGRSNALGLSVLIVNRKLDGSYRINIAKRSLKTAAHADLFHVIPACMFQPELGDEVGEWDVLHSMLKEYGEELFDKKLERKSRNSKYFYSQWPSVVELREALKDGRCKFEITGLVVNILNLRPEICALLLVEDAEWWESQEVLMGMNWEHVATQDIIKQHGRALTDFRLASAEEDYFSFFGASAGMWVPPGLAAFWLGVDAARRLTSVVKK